MSAEPFSITVREKKKLIEQLLLNNYVLVHLNTRTKGLQIPEYLKEDPTVTLKLSRHFRGCVAVEAERIVTDLTFQGKLFTCIIPWDALWGITSMSGEARIWQDCVPTKLEEFLAKQRSETPPAPATSAESNAPAKRTKKKSTRKVRPEYLKRVK